MGQQNAICLLSDGDCLCLISFQVKTMDIMIEFHKGILYGRIGMVTENEEVFFPRPHRNEVQVVRSKNPTSSSLRNLQVKRRSLRKS